MNIPSYREEELTFARRKLEKKIKEYKKAQSNQSNLPINYSDIPVKNETADGEARMLYDLKKAGKYEEIARIALERFKSGEEKTGEKYLAALYANSPRHFEMVAKELSHLGISYPVFENKAPLLKA